MPDLSIIHTVPFYEITSLLVLAAVVGSVGLLLRQPMIVSFIAVGVLAGPSVLDIVQSREKVQLLADLGIALLLFLVGLKLDLKLIRSMGLGRPQYSLNMALTSNPGPRTISRATNANTRLLVF